MERVISLELVVILKTCWKGFPIEKTACEEYTFMYAYILTYAQYKIRIVFGSGELMTTFIMHVDYG